MRLLWLSLAVILVLGLSACRDQGAPTPPAPPSPSLFVGVFDMPCPLVQQKVRAKLAGDPGLGLVKQSELQDGVAYEVPQRQEGELRWSATVRVQCTDPLGSKLSALVRAQRRTAQGWQPLRDTQELERQILDKITPQP